MNLRLALAALCALGCLACNRPAGQVVTTEHKHEHSEHEEKPEHDHEEHDHPEGVVELSADQIKFAGIRSEKIGVRELTSSVQLPATIVGDPDREVRVSARVDGVLDEVLVRLGDPVRQGQPLAIIDSPEVARLRADYRTQQTAADLARRNLERRQQLNRLGDVTRRPLEEAQRELAEARTHFKEADADTDLARIKLSRLEELLKDGIASRQQVDEARATLRGAQARREQAQTEVKVATAHLQRESRLSSTGILADNELFEAQTEYQRSEQARQAAAETLASLGATPGSVGGQVSLLSPLDGVVVRRERARGERISSGDSLLTVLNPSQVWAWVDLPDDYVARVIQGSRVELTVQGLPRQTFSGRITFVTPAADPDTKKIRARVELNNQNGKLRPNMFAQVVMPTSGARKVLVVPQAAVVTVEEQPVVYVQTNADHFQRRPITVGQESGGWTEVAQGLKAGELVVTRGALALRSQDLKASMGDGGHQH